MKDWRTAFREQIRDKGVDEPMQKFYERVESFIKTVEKEAREDERNKVIDLIDCEIDCIKSGNLLTSREQSIAIDVCKNIENRLSSLLEGEKK